MALIKENGCFVSLHDWHKDLLKEHLIVLDCGAIKLQHWSRLIGIVVKSLAESFEEFGFAQTLRAIQQNKWYGSSFAVGVGIELQLPFDFVLSNKVLKHCANI